MDNHLPVLIIGAGPTGLMAACELARQGIAFRIIDKKTQRIATSNATIIQTRTLEIFNHLGIIERFLKSGKTCTAVNLYTEGKHLFKIPLDLIESIFPFILLLEQCETEKLLTEHLTSFNHSIARGSELIDFKEENNLITSTIRLSNGKLETIVSQWLLACDGTKSTVREKCKLHFSGEELPEQFITADALIESFMSRNEIHVFFDQGTVFIAFPLRKNQYRITANLHLDYPRKIFTEKEVIELAQERAHGEYYVKKVDWISQFWVHGKVIKQMRHGRILFAGDSAHIHSPAAGQGMNNGIQDAYNLAWKLALVIKGSSKDTLLDSYQSERLPIINSMVKKNDGMTKMALFDTNFLAILRQFCKKPSPRLTVKLKKATMWLTQLDIRYEGSPIIDYQKSVSSKSPQAGQRAPDVRLSTTSCLYDYFRDTRHHALLFTSDNSKDKQLQKLYNWFKQNYLTLIQPHIITQSDMSGFEPILDAEFRIHDCYHAKKPCIYIIRPDTYIAFCTKKIELDNIKAFSKIYLPAHN